MFRRWQTIHEITRIKTTKQHEIVISPKTNDQMLLLDTAQFSVDQAMSLAEKLYAIRGTATPLASERDQNFLLVCESGEKSVLKIANALEDRALHRDSHLWKSTDDHQ